MDITEALGFASTNHRGILLTVRSDGQPQMSPIVTTSDDDGHLLISTRETAYKTKNLRRDAACSVCIFSDSFFGPWVQVDGRAEVISLPEAMDLLVDSYRRMAGEHDDWEEYRRAMEKEQRVIIRITPERAGPSVSG